MKFKGYYLLVILLLFASVANADVGIVNKVFNDNHRERILNTHIWYPSKAGHVERLAENIVFEGFDAVPNGTVLQGKYPLYILLHGSTGNWRNLSWLAARLADSGAIVVAANHPGYTSGNATKSSLIRVWEQPKDASFLIDKLLLSNFKDHIDQSRIVAIGYSLGGYSALALAGARLDMHKYIEFCRVNEDRACRYLKSAFAGLDEEFFKRSSVNLYDQRFRAVVAIAPGFVESFTSASLQKIMTPALIIGASLDKNVSPATHLLPRQGSFSKAISYKEISDAAHFSFMQICKPGGAELLAEEGAEFVCIDGKSKTRKEIHNELYEEIMELYLYL